MDWGEYLFSVRGRINRAKLWLFVPISFGVQMMANLIGVGFAGAGAGGDGRPVIAAAIIQLLAALALMVPSITLSIRRLHDRDKSGWWLLLFFLAPGIAVMFIATGSTFPNGRDITPIAGLLMLVAIGIYLWGFVELYCLRGTTGENEYGADPLNPEMQAAVFE